MSALMQRLPRLLALVPYLLSHPGVAVSTAAADLGVDPEQLRSDLNLLWMCGLPGYGPGELIDLSFEGETIDVVFDAGMSRPLRLSRGEAGALAVALRSLADVGGLLEREVVERALAKVEAAAGGAGAPDALAVGPSPPADDTRETVAALARALTEHRVVHLRYYTASRDEITERDVEPRRLVVVGGRTYLAGWCRLVEDERLFRVDRIDALDVLDEVVAPMSEDPPHAPQDEADPFDLGGDLPVAELELARTHAWVAEYYPIESSALTTTGTLRVVLRYSDDEWLLRLVLGLGSGARIVRPALIAELLVERASAALDAYHTVVGQSVPVDTDLTRRG